MMAETGRWRVVMIVLLFAAGCGMQAGPAPEAPEGKQATAVFDARSYEGIPLNRGRVFRVERASSQVLFFLWRGGPLAAKGHNHVMSVKGMEGAVFMPADLPAEPLRFDIVFQAADIEVDPLPLRAAVGGAFGTGLTEKEVRDTREHMLGEKVLDAERFPAIGLSAAKVYGEPPKLVSDTVITLHGVRRHQLIPLTLSVTDDRLDAEGAFVIMQTEFGIEPFSAMGGALYLQDPIMVQFKIVARAR